MRPQRLFLLPMVLVSSVLAWSTLAQAPAGTPPGATGLCKDGTYYKGATKQGACRGHQGVKEWYGSTSNAGGAASAPGPSADSAPHAATTSPAAATPAPAASSPSPARSSNSASATKSSATPAPGGGAGKVWLNTSSNVYHCPGSQYYGKTKAGSYMTEAEAQAKGAHPDHGKPCSK